MPDIQARTSRLPPVKNPDSHPLTKAVIDTIHAEGRRVLNLHLMQAHAPELGHAQRGVITAIRTKTAVKQSLIELGILCAGKICECEYEYTQHVTLAKKAGLTRAQIDAVGHWRSSDVYDEHQRAVLAWIEAICSNKGSVHDAIYDEMTRLFSPQEIFEITFTATLYYGTGLMMKALELQLEPESIKAAAEVK
jgi:alkylhydroperoxidase family enzyme